MTRRNLQLINEHIIETSYTLPPGWRVSKGLEWYTQTVCYICFCLHADIETSPYATVEDAINEMWKLERNRMPS